MSIPDISTSSQPTQRSARESRPPIWHKDYVTHPLYNRCLYSISTVMNYSGLSPTYQSFLSKFSTEVEPSCYAEAANNPRWVQSMQLEI